MGGRSNSHNPLRCGTILDTTAGARISGSHVPRMFEGARMRTILPYKSSVLIFTALALAGLLPAKATPAQICGGDCNEDRVVTVDELVRGVNIALGTLAIALCEPFDSNDDQLVTVDEIVAAVVSALNGCPPQATPTLSPPSTITATPLGPTATSTPSPVVTRSVSVLIATGSAFGAAGRTVTSLGVPILSPSGAVLVVGELTDDAGEPHAVLLQLRSAVGDRVLLEQGQEIPGSAASVFGIDDPNAKGAGSFALVETDLGATLLRIDDGGNLAALLGAGTAGDRADYEVREYVVPHGGDAVVAEAFAPGASRALVAASLNPDLPPMPIVARGDTISYRNDEGALIDAVVTDTTPNDSVMAAGDHGASYVVADSSIGMVLEFTYRQDADAEVAAVLVEGNQAPGLSPGTSVSRIDEGVVFGGHDELDTRGFAAFVDGEEGSRFASTVTDSDYEALVVVIEGMAVPDVPGALISSPNTPVMGRGGAVIRYRREGPGDEAETAVGFADYATGAFRTLVATGEAAPGGGTLAGIELAFALNDRGELIFRGDLDHGSAAYYALSTGTPQVTWRRLVGTGDVVMSSGGGSATITALGMIPATAGLGGEATAIGSTHFTVGATLDDGQDIEGAVLLVEIGS